MSNNSIANDIKNISNNGVNNNNDTSRTNSRRSTFIQQLSKDLNNISQNSINEEDSSWGGVLTGNVKSRNLKSSKRSSLISSNFGSLDNDPSSPISIDNDDSTSNNYYPHRYAHTKRQSFISYTESIHTYSSSDNEENNNNKNNSTNPSNNNHLDDNTSQSPDNDYEETSSSTSSADSNDMISNDDPMLLNIINMSINNYKKSEQPATATSSNFTKENSGILPTNSSLSKHSSYSMGISSMEGNKRNISFQQTPVIINSIEEEARHIESFSSENQSCTSQISDSANSSQSSLHEEVISPETLARSKTCKEYLEFRYNYIMSLIKNNQVYNPLYIINWRTRMWIQQATHGNISSLKKHKNQDFWFLDNSEISDFMNQFNNHDNTSPNSGSDNKVDSDPLSGLNTNSPNTNTSNTPNDVDKSLGMIGDSHENGGEVSHIKSSQTDTDLQHHASLDQNSNLSKNYNRRTTLPPTFDSKKALNEEFISSYKNIFKKAGGRQNNDEIESASVTTPMSNTTTTTTNSFFNISPKNDDDNEESLMDLFIPKSNNRNKKPALSIVTNNLISSSANSTNTTTGNTNDTTILHSAPLENRNSFISRPSKLSTLAERHLDIGDEFSVTSSNTRINLTGSRLLPARNRFSEIPIINKVDENGVPIPDRDEFIIESNNHLEVPLNPRRRRSSMPDISRFQNQYLNSSFINVGSSNNKKNKNFPGVMIESSCSALNYSGSNANLDTLSSTRNPLRKMLLRKRGKQSESNESGDETKYNADVTVSSAYLNGNNNNGPSDTKNIKKIFNVDSKGFRSIIKDIQPKFQYDKRISLTKNDLANSFISVQNNNDDASSVNSKQLKDNIDYNTGTIKKSEDKKKKLNLLKIKKIFERNGINGSFKHKRNSEIIINSENESDDNKREQLYNNFSSNADFYNDVEDDTSVNIDDDESYYEKRYNEILEESASPTLKLNFTNEEFLKNNELLFNCRIVLTDKPTGQIISKSFPSDSYLDRAGLEDLLNLQDKYTELYNRFKDLSENIVCSIHYNIIQANYAIYHFMKEMQKIDFESSKIKSITNDLDNKRIIEMGDIMDKGCDKSKKHGTTLSSDLNNENPTLITPDISRRKSVINRYNVKNRSFLFKNVVDDSDNESNTSSILDSPAIFEEPDDLMMSDASSSRRSSNYPKKSNLLAKKKMDSIIEDDNNSEFFTDYKPLLDDSNSTIRNNSIFRRTNSFHNNPTFNYSFDRHRRNSELKEATKPYSKKEITSNIETINKQYTDLVTIKNTINERFIINSNKIDNLINEAKKVTYTLNDDLFIRLKVFEETKQNKTYFKRNIASEIGFITLDYLLTIMGGLYWLFYKFLKTLKTVVTSPKMENENKTNNKTKNNDEINSSSNKLNTINEDNDNKYNYNADTVNLSTNIAENFRENMKRISELINSSYNKSIEEENQIINLQKKLHELRSSNKPVNKDDLYSLIRGNDSEQKIDSLDKKLNEHSTSKSTIEEMIDNKDENMNDKLTTDPNKTLNKKSDSNIVLPHMEEGSKQEISEFKNSKESISTKVENIKKINENDSVNHDHVSHSNKNINNNINNNDNNSNKNISNNNINNNDNNSNKNISNNNINNNDNNNIIINNNSSNSSISISNRENNNEFSKHNLLFENKDILYEEESDNENVMSFNTHETSQMKKFGNKFKKIIKKSKSFTDKRELNALKNSTCPTLPSHYLLKSPSNVSSDNESIIKKKPTLARRASKLLNLNNLKNIRSKEKDNKTEENISPLNIPNDNLHDNHDISYYISLSENNPTKENNNINYKKDLSDGINSNDYIANN